MFARSRRFFEKMAYHFPLAGAGRCPNQPKFLLNFVIKEFSTRPSDPVSKLIRFGLLVLASSFSVFPGLALEVPKAKALLENHCFACHDEWEQKGDLRFDQLDRLSLEERLDLLNRMQEQLFIE